MNTPEPSDNTGRRTFELIEAVRKESLEVVRAKMQGADIDGRNPLGETPLMVAAKACRRDVAKLLVTEGASVSIGNDRRPPLNEFSKRGWADLIALCLDRGESATQGGHGYQSAIEQASEFGQPEALALICSRLSCDEQTKAQKLVDALYVAQSHEVASILLEFGADPNGLSRRGLTEQSVLYGAATAGRADVCQCLIDAGANVNLRTNGRMPVYGAALYDKPLAMAVLLNAGASQYSIDEKFQNLEDVVCQGGQDVSIAYAAWRAQQSMAAARRAHCTGCTA